MRKATRLLGDAHWVKPEGQIFRLHVTTCTPLRRGRDWKTLIL